MPHNETGRIHAGQASYGPSDRKAVDLFVELDALLTAENRQPINGSPEALVIAEACAVRILCKHYGWRVVEPGMLRRVVR